MMDHRLGRREPIEIPVRLHFGDGTCARGLALNISRDGMYVATAARPGRTACVDVRMSVGDPSRRRTALFRCFLVHGTAEGFGLMFREVNDTAAALITRLMGGYEGLVSQPPRDIAATGSAARQ